MAFTEKISFTLIWRIKNFGMCCTEFGEYIASPDFKMPMFGNSECNLYLYPKGKRSKDHIACFLNCHPIGTSPFDEIKFSLSLVPESPENKFASVIQLNGFEFCGSNKLISLEDIMMYQNKYLPNDTLTLKCHFRLIYSCCISDIRYSTLENAKRRSALGQKSHIADISCIETTIHVQTKSVVWPIKNFQSSCKCATFPVQSFVKGVPSFDVSLLGDEDSAEFSIKAKKNSYSKKLFVRCNFSVLSVRKEVVCGAEDEFMCNSDCFQVRKFPPFLEPKKLEKDGYFKHTDGVLYLQFNFVFSISCEMHHCEKDFGHSNFLLSLSHSSGYIVDDVRTVSLRAGDQTFKVHRSVLIAKSKVFEAMFQNDLLEKETGIVNISDVHPKILNLMIGFFYQGTVLTSSRNNNKGDYIDSRAIVAIPKVYDLHSYLPFTDALELYAAADKYQVLTLMEQCSCILIAHMTVCNVCDILTVADLHQDQRLLKCAEDFVIHNSDQILVSQDWKGTMRKIPHVAANIMFKMLVK